MGEGKSNLVRPVLIRALLDRVAAELADEHADPVLIEQAADLRRQVTRAFATTPAAREARHAQLAESLSAQELIRHAEQLIRERYSPLSPLHAVWGKIADELNEASHLPSRSGWGNLPRDIRRFNRACTLAWQIIDQFYEREETL